MCIIPGLGLCSFKFRKYLFPEFHSLKENSLLPAVCSKFKCAYKICTCFNTGDLIIMSIWKKKFENLALAINGDT